MEDEKDINLHNEETSTETSPNDANTENENKNDPKYRGMVLMKQALEKLESGDIEAFETDRALANKYFDEMNSEEEEMDALYNESRNFGIIYNVFEANVPSLLESADGQKSLRKIVKMIKSDKALHEQFKAFNNLLPNSKIVNVDEYITEATSIIPSLDKKQVKESNEKLIRLMKSEKLNEMIDIEDDKITLFEAIEYVTLNPKSLKNIDEYVSASKVIKEHIEKIPSVSNPDATIESYAKNVEQVSESLGNDLTFDEMNIIREVCSGNGESYFNECKAETIGKLNKMILSETDMDSKSRLSVILEKIDKKSYDKKTAAVDIAEMIEMQNAIDE